jgi:aspartokinase-like uncharacterized kinase
MNTGATDLVPLVVKLGGSLLRQARLGSLLALVGAATRPVVVVPGGGPFADAVRETQAALGLDDATAHRMALLAMHQAAFALIALQPRLVPAETLPEMRRALATGMAPAWLPSRLCARDHRIPQDWSITSDGLAARLAERLGAPEVLLVKSCPVSRDAGLAELTGAGVVDPCFAGIVERAALSWRVLGIGDDDAIAAALGVCSGSTPAARRARGVARGGS